MDYRLGLMIDWSCSSEDRTLPSGPNRDDVALAYRVEGGRSQGFDSLLDRFLACNRLCDADGSYLVAQGCTHGLLQLLWYVASGHAT